MRVEEKPMRVSVRSWVSLPDAPRGVVVEVEDGPRIRGLIASGRVELIREMPAELVVPRGTIAEVLSWVGGEVDRAEVALQQEIAGTASRKTLVGKLEEIAAHGTPHDDPAAQEAAYEIFETGVGDHDGDEPSSLTGALSEFGG